MVAENKTMLSKRKASLPADEEAKATNTQPVPKMESQDVGSEAFDPFVPQQLMFSEPEEHDPFMPLVCLCWQKHSEACLILSSTTCRKFWKLATFNWNVYFVLLNSSFNNFSSLCVFICSCVGVWYYKKNLENPSPPPLFFSNEKPYDNYRFPWFTIVNLL